jgi:hypothetical protein
MRASTATAVLIIGLVAAVAGFAPAAAGQPAGNAPAGGCQFLKPNITGLVDRRGEPLSDGESEPVLLPAGGRPFRSPGESGYDDRVSPWITDGGIDGSVVSVTWAELQPTAFGPLATNNQIDKAIARVARIRDLTGVEVGLRVRLFAGIWAPDWAKALDPNDPSRTVAPVPFVDPANPTTPRTIGRYWSASFGQAYDDVMTKLAGAYDTNCAVREITLGRCTTIFNETFIREPDSPNPDNLHAAGYTDALDRQCVRDQLGSARSFRYTRIYLATNPYQGIRDVKPYFYVDVPFTLSVMDSCRSQLGDRCLIANNSIRFNRVLQGGEDPNVDWNGSYLGQGYPNYPYRQLYQGHKARGGPLAYQTADAPRVQSLPNTILFASEELGGSSVELPFLYSGPSKPTAVLPFEGFETFAGLTAASNTGAAVRPSDPASLRAAAAELDARFEGRAPALPTDFAASASSPTSTTLTWTPGLRSTGTRVLRDGVETSGLLTASTYTDNSLAPGEHHSYALTAHNGVGSTWPTASVTVDLPPPAPSGLTVAGVSGDPSRLTVTWNAVAGAVRYDVDRAGAATVSVSGTTADLTGLAPDTTYAVSVRAVTSTGLASTTSIANGRTVPAAPAQLVVARVNGKPTSLSLTWMTVSGALRYEIWRNGKLLTSVTSTSYTNSGLARRTTYAYGVRAVGAGGPGPFVTASGTTG